MLPRCSAIYFLFPRSFQQFLRRKRTQHFLDQKKNKNKTLPVNIFAGSNYISFTTFFGKTEKSFLGDRVGLACTVLALTSTPSDTFRMNWNFHCEQGFIARHQWLTTLTLLWGWVPEESRLLEQLINTHGFGMRWAPIHLAITGPD